MSQLQSLDCRENIMTADPSVADKRLNYNYHLDGWGEGGGGKLAWSNDAIPLDLL